MKIKSVLISSLCMFILLSISCGSTSSKPADEETKEVDSINQDTAVLNRTIYYDGTFKREKAFIVISKKRTELSVYLPTDSDTILLVRYPVCLSKNPGQKQKKGDMKTPECSMENPFTITQIQPSSSWKHDFGDGRGSIPAYGNWFLRLSTPPHTGIGIHGSTNNRESVPGRASEGCIRMFDEDIIHLKENYAFTGMKVIVKHEDQDLFDFEKNLKLPKVPVENVANTDTDNSDKAQSPAIVRRDTIPSSNEVGFKEYTVKSRDVLSAIASKHNTTVEAITELNDIKDPDKIKAGDVIKIPL
ncbi:MAG: LysM peptidoglycan-binding domain-containing protein [Veillonella sp.]|nr:LysM peptidoglycan-binding domain-containing protein [Veillonella sp.]